ncbi:hypothetical protein VOLCADRAFT_104621 [Volvox carteri f. nagariensis]|uniref:Uncharacterized protein n=1 Tax=Volvox carteri f. nagariensis TaxID=3068 RepID=D8TUX9_VOLCA|nr:uncharacterized protein VOLCADRAFT_104621 [Volvox carteri f. nagariensis]EFJ48791.1 hypothetical protein VOLCADRAFT_104621 [Volvox carteri f. nagariensis]|eukprot:XP_002950123.1 hypothetical protein VOLCADRAFT_104621 [Volvox carteri f. nagariensis]
MQLTRCLSTSKPCARSVSRKLLIVRAQLDSPAVGSKVERWLKTPFDILAFGPRAGAGALLSAPERLQTLQSDFEKALELLQDPRPIEEKQTVLLKEVEETLVGFLEKGATVESDVLANVKTLLPPEAANLLNEFIPEPPNKQPDVVPVEAVDAAPQPPVTYYQADVMANQVASEMTEIKKAVSGLKTALDAVRQNTEVANTNILRLNLREARDQLARRVAEVSASTESDPSIAAATREAKILLEEVDSSFFAS